VNELDTEFDDELFHIGVLRKSGRYPWGSGDNPNQRNKGFLDHVDGLKKQGLSEKDIADGLGITTTQLRAAKSIAKNAQKKADISQAMILKERGLSNVAIGEKMGVNESQVRQLLNPTQKEKNNVLQTTADKLKQKTDEYGAVDIGMGVEHHLGVSRTQLKNAAALLEAEGYGIQYVNVDQQGTGKVTKMIVLTKPDTTYSELYQNKDKIHTIGAYSDDGGHTFRDVKSPISVDSKRIAVRYAEEGGTDADGTIHLRRGVDDISLGSKQYAQVRIAVDGTHYLKGMAMYRDDLPDGVDMVFNTNKSDKGDKLKAMKPMKDDEENPFGSVVHQRYYKGPDGKMKQSVINVVNEEGDWDGWSRNLSSQVLSKQPVQLAKQQLDLKMKAKQAEYDEIMALTNPAVKKKLLESFSDDLDSSSVHLKAAALPRQRTQVILPINSLKDTEVYAPNFKNGERVALVRYPHGGTFEIPELTVNNRNKEAGGIMKGAIDAIGINSTVASRLSGADFDGDTVLVIPNNLKQIKSKRPLKELEGFDPQAAYPAYDGMPKMSAKTKQLKMGDVSNLITDMTVRGASDSEIARAVKHSMVVIDAEKHNLNWRQSAKDNNISQLKEKYQGDARSGASTLISKASSETSVNERRAARTTEGGAINKTTGKRQYVETGANYVKPAYTTVNARTGKVTEHPAQVIFKKDKITKMEATDDAFTLSSGTPMEEVYARHANRLKDLADKGRVAMVNTPPLRYSPQAKVAYDPQVKSLNAKLALAQRNKPLERQAQLLAGTIVKAKQDANPHLDKADLKKIKGQALLTARERVGAKKDQVDITPIEWAAIQAGAITNNKLESILANTDVDRIKELATPREATVMVQSKVLRAKAMLAAGFDASEIADALGVNVSTLNSSIERS
jgi:transcriptional regulator with XRE-family HTH domain